MLTEYNLLHSRPMFIVVHLCTVFVCTLAYMTYRARLLEDYVTPWPVGALVPLAAAPWLIWRGHWRLAKTVGTSCFFMALLVPVAPYLVMAFVLLTTAFNHWALAG